MSEATSIDIPFQQFVPLIKDGGEILVETMDLYNTAKHNIKLVTKPLAERIAAANFALGLLRNDNLHTLSHYTNLQRLVQVIRKM